MIGAQLAACARKVRHATKAEAEAARGDNPRLRSYRCGCCEGYHLGRPIGRKRFRSHTNTKARAS